MYTQHPTLLVGPADWDPLRLPKEEFLGRLAALWRDADPGIVGAVVYGSPSDHAELAYLTHFTPKLEPAIALIPRAGEPRLLVGGGANMIGAAKPLTWVETLLPLRDSGATIARWAQGLGSGGLALVNGDAVRFGLRQEIATTLGAPLPDVTRIVAAAMRRKSAREMALVREACAGLTAAHAAMRDAQQAGRGMTDVVLAGEQAAWRRGAQDVRSLFGRRGRLMPFTIPVADAADPLQVYLAVRHDGYWAEGFAVLSRAAQSGARATLAVLDDAIACLRPGAPHRAFRELIAAAVPVRRRHQAARHDTGHSIGLALQEPGRLNDAGDGSFESGEVYTVRMGMSELDTDAMISGAIVSAMVAITDQGPEVLWRGVDA
jgi:Xaa-Pro aminopeptidase